MDSNWRGVVEDRVGCRRRAARQAVGEDDVCRLAAELERDPLDRPCVPHDPAADLGRAGEADLRHVGMLDEPAADHESCADEDVHDPPRNARVRARARRAAGRRGVTRPGLEHDGVAEGQPAQASSS